MLMGQDEPREENFEGRKAGGGTVYAGRRTQKAEMGASRRKVPPHKITGWSDQRCTSLAPKTWRQPLKHGIISNKKPDFQILLKIQ